ncbi:hypothetical protein AAVH_23914 [Aphelenchoides avenae]|nr:hypothetical protein AAVH_23914 [Aphelenchus avenae]
MEGGGCDNARWCTIIASTSTSYAVFHFSFITISHLVGFSSMMRLFEMTKTSTGLSKTSKKHIFLGLLETGSYTLCVALPSAVMVARLFAAWSESILIDVVSLCIPYGENNEILSESRFF